MFLYKLDKSGQKVGIRKFREEIKQENGNKLIVLDEDPYANLTSRS